VCLFGEDGFVAAAKALPLDAALASWLVLVALYMAAFACNAAGANLGHASPRGPGSVLDRKPECEKVVLVRS
jgi:hypothetical protein